MGLFKKLVGPKLTPRRLREQERRRFLQIRVPVKGGKPIKLETDEEPALEAIKDSFKKKLMKIQPTISKFQEEPITSDSFVNRFKDTSP